MRGVSKLRTKRQARVYADNSNKWWLLAKTMRRVATLRSKQFREYQLSDINNSQILKVFKYRVRGHGGVHPWKKPEVKKSSLDCPFNIHGGTFLDNRHPLLDTSFRISETLDRSADFYTLLHHRPVTRIYSKRSCAAGAINKHAPVWCVYRSKWCSRTKYIVHTCICYGEMWKQDVHAIHMYHLQYVCVHIQ